MIIIIFIIIIIIIIVIIIIIIIFINIFVIITQIFNITNIIIIIFMNLQIIDSQLKQTKYYGQRTTRGVNETNYQLIWQDCSPDKQCQNGATFPIKVSNWSKSHCFPDIFSISRKYLAVGEISKWWKEVIKIFQGLSQIMTPSYQRTIMGKHLSTRFAR